MIRRRQKPAVQLDMSVDHPLHGKVALHPRSRGCRETRRSLWLGQKSSGSLRELRPVANRNDEPRFVMRDQFQIRRDVADDNGNSVCHRFHQAVRLPFKIARQPEHVELLQQRTGVEPVPGKPHVIIDSNPSCEQLEDLALRSVTDDQKRHVWIERLQ